MCTRLILCFRRRSLIRLAATCLTVGSSQFRRLPATVHSPGNTPLDVLCVFISQVVAIAWTYTTRTLLGNSWSLRRCCKYQHAKVVPAYNVV